jgi:hypothetical protein
MLDARKKRIFLPHLFKLMTVCLLSSTIHTANSANQSNSNARLSVLTYNVLYKSIRAYPRNTGIVSLEGKDNYCCMRTSFSTAWQTP